MRFKRVVGDPAENFDAFTERLFGFVQLQRRQTRAWVVSR